MTATGIVCERHAEGRTPAEAGTVIAAREINIVPLATEKIGAVAADPFDTGPGIVERYMGQFRESLLEPGPVNGLSMGQLLIGQQCGAIILRRVAQTYSPVRRQPHARAAALTKALIAPLAAEYKSNKRPFRQAHRVSPGRQSVVNCRFEVVSGQRQLDLRGDDN